MVLRKLAVAFFTVGMLAGTALAQSAPATAEFGRASGGEIDVRAKQGNQFSGSLSLTASSGGSVAGLPGGMGRALGATAGGALIADRLWFFGSAEWNQQSIASRYSPVLPQPEANGSASAMHAGATAIIGDRQTLLTSFTTGATDTASPFATTLPSSFLSLHYTGVVSSNSFFSVSASRRQVSTAPLLFPGSADPQ